MPPGHVTWKTTLTLVILTYIMSLTLGRECRDRATWCSKLGKQHPLSRCYEKERRCCRTCTKLRTTIPDCPYGDRESWCDEIGYGRPTSLCYTHNHTCCQTCHLYDSGIADCRFGDMLKWCSGIGTRYTVNSCYENAPDCCDTCNKLRSADPECPYGDRATWCNLIGDTISETYCLTSKDCCQTCGKILAHRTTEGRMNTTSATPTKSKLVSTSATNVTSTTTPGGDAWQGHVGGSQSTSSINSSTANLASLSTTATPFDTNHVPQKDGVITQTVTSVRGVLVTSRAPTHPAAPSTVATQNVTIAATLNKNTTSTVPNINVKDASGAEVKSTTKVDPSHDPGSVSGERSKENITLDKTGPAANSSMTHKTNKDKTRDVGSEYSPVKDDRDKQAVAAPGPGVSSASQHSAQLHLAAFIYVTLRLLTC